MNYTKIKLPYTLKKCILALGAQSKSGFCLAKGDVAYLSESGGDLADLENFKKFKKDVRTFKKRFNIKPNIIACDMHPEYTAAKDIDEFLENKSQRIVKVQHHKAHIASCIVDNGIKGDVIGVAFDGTGFGEDENIWGGEFFVGNIHNLKRAAHVKYMPMPGGEACVREPWRMAFSYLYNIYGRKFKNFKIGFVSKLDKDKTDILLQMLDKNINSPLCSSMGRLFDTVSALSGICRIAAHEGEAAVKLEKEIKLVQSSEFRAQRYRFNMDKDGDCYVVNADRVIKDIVKDIEKDVSKGVISLKFHEAICDMIKETCDVLRKKYKIKKVCFSGGVFQNRFLDRYVLIELEQAGFQVYMHKRIPCHDGGISVGQVMLAGQHQRVFICA
jgi:hydrogenase maturation protein HypF